MDIGVSQRGHDVYTCRERLFLKIKYEVHVLFKGSPIGINQMVPETKIAEFANSLDLDEVAQHEPTHLDLHCLPSSL